MCIAYPARVLAVHGDGGATVDVFGRSQVVLLTLIADDTPHLTVGDWLLVQTGLALARIDQSEADQRMALITATSTEVTQASTEGTQTWGGTP